MGHSDLYVARRSQILDDLRRTVEPADDDPEYNHDQALRAIQSARNALAAIDPRKIDALALMDLAGDLREMAMTAYDAQRNARRIG
jgi:hypothetical protein